MPSSTSPRMLCRIASAACTDARINTLAGRSWLAIPRAAAFARGCAHTKKARAVPQAFRSNKMVLALNGRAMVSAVLGKVGRCLNGVGCPLHAANQGCPGHGAAHASGWVWCPDLVLPHGVEGLYNVVPRGQRVHVHLAKQLLPRLPRLHVQLERFLVTLHRHAVVCLAPSLPCSDLVAPPPRHAAADAQTNRRQK